MSIHSFQLMAAAAMPCPVVITDATGAVLAVNAEFERTVGGAVGCVSVGGGAAQPLAGRPFHKLLPPATGIFLQTHVWPMLHHHGQVREIYMHLKGAAGLQVPVLVNCDRHEHPEGDFYVWVLFVAEQRSRFEAELLTARQQADQASNALLKSERFLRTVTDAVPGLVAYWDDGLRCRFTNQGHSAWYDRPTAEVLGQRMEDITAPTLFQKLRPHVVAALSGEQQSFETVETGPDGLQRNHLNHFIPDVSKDGTTQGFYVLAVDITEIKEAQAELQLAHSAMSNTAECVVVTDKSGRVLSINPAITAIAGYEPSQLIGTNLSSIQQNPNDAALRALTEKALAETGTHRGEVWVRHKDGEPVLAWQTVTRFPSSGGGGERRVVVLHDITARGRDHERLRHLAFHDPLTDLPNRALLLERLNQAVGRCKREERALALLYLDLDGFKGVNDSLGHGAGDELLREAARRLLQLVRRSDTVARLGGDEFAILIDNPGHVGEVELVAQRVLQALSTHFKLVEGIAHISASVGITLNNPRLVSGEALLKRADKALYVAKKSGKNAYRFAGKIDLASLGRLAKERLQNLPAGTGSATLMT